jgi:hypothetical protein
VYALALNYFEDIKTFVKAVTIRIRYVSVSLTTSVLKEASFELSTYCLVHFFIAASGMFLDTDDRKAFGYRITLG